MVDFISKHPKDERFQNMIIELNIIKQVKKELRQLPIKRLVSMLHNKSLLNAFISYKLSQTVGKEPLVFPESQI